VHTTDQNVTVTLSYPLSYLILSHSSSKRSYFCKNIGYFWIFCVFVIRMAGDGSITVTNMVPSSPPVTTGMVTK